MLTSKNKFVLSMLLSQFLLAGCGNVASPTAKQADPDVRKSLQGISKADVEALKGSGLGVEVYKSSNFLKLQKSALDKEFLLSASAIPQRGAATSSGLQSRVVAFSLKGNEIFLMESIEGQAVSPTLPADLILTQIPVLTETEDAYVLDFNAGMSAVFAQGNWHASDMQGRAHKVEETGKIVSVRMSYLKKIEALDEEFLEIRQVAQVNGSKGVEGYEVRYFLSPYRKSETYQPKETAIKFDKAGYFETPPILEQTTGRTIVRPTLFDATKPIKFYVSANTPKEYQEAVKDGILYWNKAFGKEIVVAEVAPRHITAPDPRHNIVQWVEWDNAGFAYADALMDPRTGEIRHAQVYMTSAFAWGSSMRAQVLSRNLSNSEQVEADLQNLTQSLGLKGMSSSVQCLNNRSSHIAQVARVSLSSGLSDEAMLRMSQDYVREVIAHEVGHTLGLRHNFAGNMESSHSPKDIQKRFETLLFDESTRTDDMVVSNSVMEYQALADSVIIGRQIARGEVPLAYDAFAVRTAYFNEVVNGTTPLFCTDSHAAIYQDCVRFDRGRNPIEGAKYVFESALRDLPMTYVEAFLAKMSATFEVDRAPITAVDVDYKTLTAPLVLEVKTLTSYLDTSLKSIILERRYETLTSLKDKDLIKDRYNWLSQRAVDHGGWEALYFDMLSEDSNNNLLSKDWVSHQVEAVRNYLDKPLVRNYMGRDGKRRQLTNTEVKFIVDRAEQFFTDSRQQLVTSILTLYKAAKWGLEIDATDSIEDTGLTLSLESALAKVAPVILTQRSDTLTQSVPQADGSVVERAAFDFKVAARSEMAHLLAPTFIDLANWSQTARETSREIYREIVRENTGVNLVKDIDDLIKAGNRRLQIWWKAEKPIWTLLRGPESPAEKAPAPTPPTNAPPAASLIE